MASTITETQDLNPWALHLQKLLDLKCPLCLKSLKKPAVLPCDHIFCNVCITTSAQLKSECPACKHQFNNEAFVTRKTEDMTVMWLCRYGGNMSRSNGSGEYVGGSSVVFMTQDDVTICELKQNVCSVCGWNDREVDVELTWRMLVYDNPQYFELVPIHSPLTLEAMFHVVKQGSVKCLQIFVDSRANPRIPVVTTLERDARMVSELSPVTSTKTIEDKSRRPPLPDQLKRTSIDWQSDILLKANKLNNSCIGKKIPSSEKTAKTSLLLGGAPNEEIETGRNSESQVGIFQGVRNTDGTQKPVIDKYQVLQQSPDRKNEWQLLSVGTESDSQYITWDNIFQARGGKRQKKFSYDSHKTGALSHGHTQQGSCMQSKFEKHHAVAQSSDPSKSVCAFCHSSKITEGSGPMLYYAHGKEVVGDISSLPKVIPLHRKCIEWTPQVYCEGDNIRNLEPELARAAKLICTSCGIRGASLSCFAKSCRKTYHVPCAFDIQECRRDSDDFLVLCPSHKHYKFPREKPKPVKFTRRKVQTFKDKPETCNSSEKHLVSDQMGEGSHGSFTPLNEEEPYEVGLEYHGCNEGPKTAD